MIRAPFHPEDAETTRTSEKVQDAVIETLVTCARYQVQKTELNGSLTRTWDAPFVNLSVLEGEGTIEGKPVKKGVHLIIPYQYGPVAMRGNMMMITSTPEKA